MLEGNVELVQMEGAGLGSESPSGFFWRVRVAIYHHRDMTTALYM
jgi:hypothetical protein